MPLTQIPLKGEYAKRDFYRSARFHGLGYRHPEPFPVNTVAACRAFYSLAEEKDAVRLAVRDKTKSEVDAAPAKGVFGSPYVVVDGEPFWGLDRFDQIDRWLKAPF